MSSSFAAARHTAVQLPKHSVALVNIAKIAIIREAKMNTRPSVAEPLLTDQLKSGPVAL